MALTVSRKNGPKYLYILIASVKNTNRKITTKVKISTSFVKTFFVKFRLVACELISPQFL